MTIKECERTKGIEALCDIKYHRWGEIEVNFYNPVDQRDDSTSFDICMPLGNSGLCELISLYEDFCKENGIPKNTVESLFLTCVADSYDELTQMC